MALPWILLPFLLLGAGVTLFAAVYRRTLSAFWREPVLKSPVLIFECDDWGPGPASDVQTLERLMLLLAGHKDQAGQPAAMTLGVVLAIPDGALICDNDFQHYYRITLADETFELLRGIFLSGVRQGVFSLQLHGLEHFWPASVIAAAQKSESIRNWLAGDAPVAADLPPALQSRWCDGTVLPSRELDVATVRQAAASEVEIFSHIFGMTPAVAVPPTFIWNDAVEDGWARAGVRVVISPGRRQEGRDRTSHPIGPEPNRPGGLHVNGMQSRCGLTYLVRNGWFEPERGHTADQAIDTLVRQSELGRPMLFETHRSNFVGKGPAVERAFAELDALLKNGLQRFPGLRFCTSEKLAALLKRSDENWVETGFWRRLAVFMRRVLEHHPLKRLAVLTGTFLVLRVGVRLSKRRK